MAAPRANHFCELSLTDIGLKLKQDYEVNQFVLPYRHYDPWMLTNVIYRHRSLANYACMILVSREPAVINQKSIGEILCGNWGNCISQ